MESLETELINYESAVVFAADDVQHDVHPVIAVFDPEEIAFELGAWLIGLRAFSRACTDAFADEGNTQAAALDRTREFRISHAALLKCADLNFRLRKTMTSKEDSALLLERAGVSVRDIDDLAADLRGMILLNESISASPTQSFGEWRSWNAAMDRQFALSTTVGRLSSFVLNDGKRELPKKLLELFERPSVGFSDRVDIDDILPRVGTILRCLEIIGRMLHNDKPLKPSLVIFAAVYEHTGQLIEHINNRLARFPNEEAALFNSLDSASYGASLELKKVFKQELRGIVRLLPPPSVHARVETAYALLLDSFQQILIELARAVDPNASPFDFFPRFQLKLDQSLVLRDHLWKIFKNVQSAEQSPEKPVVDELRTELTSFLGSTINFLHYKDGETLERFNEEVHAARDKKDLVPILHRFGAYLETLFGQICMRAVLAGHPFDRTN